MPPLYVAIIAAFSTVAASVATVITKFVSNKPDRMSAAATLSAASLQLIEPQAERLEQIQAELHELRDNQVEMITEIRKLKTDIRSLTQQVVDLGHVPVTQLRNP